VSRATQVQDLFFHMSLKFPLSGDIKPNSALSEIKKSRFLKNKFFEVSPRWMIFNSRRVSGPFLAV